MSGVPNVFGSATSSIPLSQLDVNFNTPLYIGNTSVGLGNTVTSFGNVTLVNATLTSANVSISGGTANGVVYINSSNVATANASVLALDGSGNLKFNSGYGSAATAYGCRVWVNFGYVTGSITIRGSGNVSSVTRSSTGNYFVNFSTAMPDANYAVIATGSVSDGVTGSIFVNGANQGSSSCQINSAIGSDVTYCQVALFR